MGYLQAAQQMLNHQNTSLANHIFYMQTICGGHRYFFECNDGLADADNPRNDSGEFQAHDEGYSQYQFPVYGKFFPGGTMRAAAG